MGVSRLLVADQSTGIYDTSVEEWFFRCSFVHLDNYFVETEPTCHFRYPMHIRLFICIAAEASERANFTGSISATRRQCRLGFPLICAMEIARAGKDVHS